MADRLDRVEQLMEELQNRSRKWFKENEPKRDDMVTMFFEPETEFEAKRGVVTVSDFIMHLHWATAWFCFRTFPFLLRQRVEDFAVKKGAAMAAKIAAKKAIGEAPGVGIVAGVVGDAVSEDVETHEAKIFEKAIRDMIGDMRRDMVAGALNSDGKRGSVRDVKTRHVTPQKRRQRGFKSR